MDLLSMQDVLASDDLYPKTKESYSVKRTISRSQSLLQKPKRQKEGKNIWLLVYKCAVLSIILSVGQQADG